MPKSIPGSCDGLFCAKALGHYEILKIENIKNSQNRFTMENLREKKERSLGRRPHCFDCHYSCFGLDRIIPCLNRSPQIIQGASRSDTSTGFRERCPARVVEFMVEEGQHVLAGGYIGYISFIVGRGETLTGPRLWKPSS